MTLGMRILSLRESHNLTQKELASKLELSTGIIAEWEADESTPTFALLVKMCEIFSISPDSFLEGVTDEIRLSNSAENPPKISVIPVTTKHKPRTLIIFAIIVLALIVIILILFLKSSLVTSNEPPVTTSVPTTASATVLTTAPTQPISFSDDTNAIEAADASVVTIFCYDHKGKLSATGSGFVAFNGNTVVTNYHVMTSAHTCKISTNQDISYNVSGIICYSEAQDIAILQLSNDTGLTPLVLGNSTSVKKGETVVAIGSPLGIKNTVSTGVLSGRIMEENMDVLQFTAPISSGSSGGALFNNEGNVIGITFASYSEGQNLNLAIPAELATELYLEKGSAKDTSTIYLKEHPYVEYLDEYINAPNVDLQELRQNPTKYDDIYVKLTAYISSQSFESKDWYEWYISEEEYVSFDYEYDKNLNIQALSGVSYRNRSSIPCIVSRSSVKYIDDSIIEGDEVEIIALFEFYPEGEPLSKDNPDSTLWPYDFARLLSIIMIRAN